MRKAASLCLSTLIAPALAVTIALAVTEAKAVEVKASELSAKEQEEREVREVSEVQPTRDSDDLFTETSARSLLMVARQCMRHHNYNKAITLLSRAVKLDPDDPDVICLYAEALEEKLSHQVEKDPTVFNLCVKNWLTILRNEAGEEKGATYKGIGIGMGYFQDEERTTRAKLRLKALTGYIPKPWETNDRYLRRVLKPATTSVTATIKVPEETGPKEKAKTQR
ncbi:MAG: tetratricopeptide repeat protein [Candidatus Melainabacteria bacterium]|nr:tetratricopeptide repeat protein [Candidatus Melainabacteria bacterium]